MDLQLRDTVAIVTGSSRGPRPRQRQRARRRRRAGRRLRPRRRHASTPRARRSLPRPARPAPIACSPCRSTVDRGRTGGARRADGRALRRRRHARQQRRPGKGGGLVDTPDAVWQEAFDQTLYPGDSRLARWRCRTCSRAAAASIVLIASIWGRESGGRMTYNAVKAAEISLGKALAQQLAPTNIRVNTIAPGSILFPGGSWHQRQQADPEGIARVRRARAAVRPLRPRRGSRRRRGVPRLAARELGQRRLHPRRRLPVRSRTSDADRYAAPMTADSVRSRSSGGRRAVHAVARGPAVRHRPVPDAPLPLRAGPPLPRGAARDAVGREPSGTRGALTPFQAFMTALARIDRHRQHRRRRHGDRLRRARRAVLDLVLRLRRHGDQVHRGGARRDSSARSSGDGHADRADVLPARRPEARRRWRGSTRSSPASRRSPPRRSPSPTRSRWCCNSAVRHADVAVGHRRSRC